jgi:hypothetical protein
MYKFILPLLLLCVGQSLALADSHCKEEFKQIKFLKNLPHHSFKFIAHNACRKGKFSRYKLYGVDVVMMKDDIIVWKAHFKNGTWAPYANKIILKNNQYSELLTEKIEYVMLDFNKSTLSSRHHFLNL